MQKQHCFSAVFLVSSEKWSQGPWVRKLLLMVSSLEVGREDTKRVVCSAFVF